MPIMSLEEALKKTGTQHGQYTVSSPNVEEPPAPKGPSLGGFLGTVSNTYKSIYSGASNALMGLFDPTSADMVAQSQRQLEESRQKLRDQMFKNQQAGKDNTRLQKMSEDIKGGLDNMKSLASTTGFGADIRNSVGNRVGTAAQYAKDEGQSLLDKAQHGDVAGAISQGMGSAQRIGAVGAGQAIGAVNDTVGSAISRGFQGTLSQDQKDQATNAMAQAFQTDLGQHVIAALNSGEEKYHEFKAANPHAATEIESLTNILMSLPPVKASQLGLRSAETVAKVAGETAQQAAKKVAQTAGETAAKVSVQDAKDVFTGAKNKAGQMFSSAAENLPQSMKESIAGVTPTEKMALSPSQRVAEGLKGAVARGDITPDQAATAMERTAGKSAQQAETHSKLFDEYVRKAERATITPTAATPMEIAGEVHGTKALEKLQSKMTKAGELKSAELAKVADETFQGMSAHRESLMKNMEDKLGTVFDQEGQLVSAPGRSSKIDLDPSDQKIIKQIFTKLNSLGNTPTHRMVDDAIDAIQGFLYNSKKPNAAIQVNPAVESIVKQVTGEMNNSLKNQVGGAYRKANQTYAAYRQVFDELNKALGSEATKGGALMKTLFSPQTGLRTKKLFEKVRKMTGIDLPTHAQLSKMAMELAGDTRQRGLLESLGVIEKGMAGAVRAAAGKVPMLGPLLDVGEEGLKQSINKKKVLRGISEQAQKGGQPRPKVQGPSDGANRSVKELLFGMSNGKYEPAFVQRINHETGDAEMFAIPRGGLEKYKALIDDAKYGAAGETYDGWNWHITSTDPQRIDGAVKSGFIYKGEIPKDLTKDLQKIQAKKKEVKETFSSEAVKNVGKGFFGTMFSGPKGRKAIDFLLGNKEGEVIGAYNRPEIGDIDLVWGKPGLGKDGGHGLAHIESEHPEIIDHLDEIIGKGEIEKLGKTRIKIRFKTKDHAAVISLDHRGNNKNWIITAYKEE